MFPEKPEMHIFRPEYNIMCSQRRPTRKFDGKCAGNLEKFALFAQTILNFTAKGVSKKTGFDNMNIKPVR